MPSLQQIFKKLSGNKNICVKSWCSYHGGITIVIEEAYTYREQLTVTLDLSKPMSEQQELVDKLKTYYV